MSKISVNPNEVLNMLANGKTREEIRLTYNLSKSDMKLVFQHPLLKGKKTKKEPAFVFSDGTSVTGFVSQEPVEEQNAPVVDIPEVNLPVEPAQVTTDDVVEESVEDVNTTTKNAAW